MSESMRMQSQLAADLEVYRAKGELTALRAENARLRKALKTLSRYVVIMGSRGEYQQGQLDVLEYIHEISNAALQLERGRND